MRTVLTAAAALVVGATTGVTPAAAAPAPRSVSLSAYLSGAQEVPKGKGDPDATGIALLQLHRDGRLCYVLRVRNVGGDIDAAHLHRGRPGKNGPVSAPLAAPVWSGSVAACTRVGDRLAWRLRDDPERYYVNVHSSAYPDGALRGQLHRT
ncbi:CHRD domain-containing protein [Dactylosporangium aurantiacum]|uniref:CHRD domain-containing protein n=1 Tax=Dactylosporangium aurantiacum TaxID=35754 RepID=A0A9Q9ILH4_9ACTN|nr:CHRD domain-containing protein [Dactylosporangium aurantiacum]MDG6104411.1 CHRD domain-containing protein [Dactylosporangium aurantiacum]UWZ56032.1 CHRD domain-containing protein [Dactylosporangium aurantiacum]